MKRKIILSAGVAFGAACGYLYWYYIGCTNGSCAITSSPVNSTLYGSLMGGMHSIQKGLLILVNTMTGINIWP